VPTILTSRVIATAPARHTSVRRSRLCRPPESDLRAARERVGGRKERPTDYVGVAREHRERHRLATCAPKPKMIAPKIPPAAVGTKIARIASSAWRPSRRRLSRSFDGTATSASREIAGDGRQHHDCQDDRGRQQSGTAKSVPKIESIRDASAANSRADARMESRRRFP